MGNLKWQQVALILSLILIGAGSITYTDLFSSLFELKGINATYSGDQICASECESYINITTTYWRICFSHYNNSKYENETLFKKRSRSRTLHVNLDNVDSIISTNPEVQVDWLFPARGKGNWRPLKDGDCWERGKINRIKLVGHKDPYETVKWGFGIGGEINLSIDPKWIGIKKKEKINYTYTTETHCQGGTCWKALYSGTHFGYEDKKWKSLEELRSFKDSTNIKCIVKTDKGLIAECLDWNSTHRKIKFKPTLGILNKYKANIPIKVLKRNSTNETQLIEKSKSIKNFKIDRKQTDWIKADFGDIIHFGENSTTIQLQDADTENLNDDDSYQAGNEDEMFVMGEQYYDIYGETGIMFNISSIPSGQQIDDAKLIIYLSSNVDSITGQCYEYSNRTWNEEDGIGDKNSVGSYLSNYSSTSVGSKECNVTTWVSSEYNSNYENVSIALKDSCVDNCYHKIFSKEYITTAKRPCLNITYSAAGDGTAPTSNSPSDASYIQNSAQTIGWILQDETGAGNYTVLRNGTIQNSSTSWTNNTNLGVWVNTTTIGNNWNYTIYFNDSAGNDGTSDSVFINITADVTAPMYSDNSTNSTIAGTSIEHRLKWQDETGLSGYIFSFCNGTWNGTSCEYGFWKSGKVGNALNFDGVDDYVNCGNDSSLNFGSGNFTFEAWAKTLSFISSRELVSKFAPAQCIGFSVHFASSGELNFLVDGGGSEITISTTNTYNDGNWHHIVAMRDGNTGRIYVDGIENAIGNFSAVGNINNIHNLSFGRNIFSSYFNGTIDAVKIYNRSLNSTEINWSYQKGSSGLPSNISTTGLVGYWSLNESSGIIAEDTSGEGNNGTLTNFVGVFTNDSWFAMSGNLNWSNVTKTVSSTVGDTIAWKVYANDTSDNWNTSEIYSYITTSTDTCTYTSGNWAITCSDNCSFPLTDVGGNNVTITGSGGYAKWIMNITNYTSFVISGGCETYAKDG